jgi:single-strand DNA-binding protein
MYNKVTLVGRLGKEPEIRHTQDKAPIATLSLATTDYRKDSAGKSTPHTEWHRAVLFGKLAEIVRDRNPKKGSMILIEGSLRTRKWQDNAKVDHYTTEIVADIYTEIGTKSENSSNASDDQGQ